MEQSISDVPSGVTWDIPTGTTLIIPSNEFLNNYGTISNSGTITIDNYGFNSGTINISGTIKK